MPQLNHPNSVASSKIFNISRDGLQELHKAGIDLNGLFLLDCLKNNVDLSSFNGKMESWHQELLRKGFINATGTLSTTGALLLDCMETGIPFSVISKALPGAAIIEFERWWKTYPATDVFEYKGKKFEGTRGFKVKKADCKVRFDKITNEGEYTADDLIRALEYEIMLKKEASIKEGDNKLRYMQNTHTYLLQRTFENFIELSKTVKIKPNSSTNNMDI